MPDTAMPENPSAPLDPAFRAMILDVTAARAAQVRGGATLALAWERDGGCVARYDLLLPPATAGEEVVFRLAERVVKFLLWSAGGWRLLLAGPEGLCRRLQAEYSAQGRRAFDAAIMQRVYGRPMTVAMVRPEEMPAARDAGLTLGGHLEGCRLGFDLGASDLKVSAVQDGVAVFSAEVPWTPRSQSDPDYHYRIIQAGLRQAAAHLPRVDAIGGSTAGVVVDNRIMVASLFRAVPPERYAEAQDLFLRLQREWQVPLAVANDGDVAALAGALSLGVQAILGVAMGSSEAGGFLDRQSRLTGRLTELAFAPVDMNPGAGVDEWSGDAGVGALYFSQQAVNRLAPAAGFAFPDDQPLPARLQAVQARLAAGDERARRIFETIGVYLGYTVPWYREFNDFDHLLLLGRVTSGAGGDIIRARAEAVLHAEFPDLAARVRICLPDERARRVGQAVAAASLPVLPRSGP